MSGTSPWLPLCNPQAKFRLFCFPYAGGGASLYRLWSRLLPADVDVCPVHLPGRETRLPEPLFTHLIPLIEAGAQALSPYCDVPFAFFGHSMGALISFEMARSLRRHQRLTPVHLFVSAYRAPQLPLSREMIHHLAAPEFLRSVFRMGGTPSDVLLNKELVDLFLPILRADFTLYETYTYSEEEPFQCALSVFGGERDLLVSIQELRAWQQQSSGPFALYMLPGNHFFIQSSQQLLLQIIARELAYHAR